MCRNQRLELVQPESSLNYNIPRRHGEYDPGQLSSIIKRYQELRSVVELTAVRHERVSGGSQESGKEELICILVDIDEGMRYLSPRQELVMNMLKQGYQYEDISYMLGISVATVKFHERQGIFCLTTYLNWH